MSFYRRDSETPDFSGLTVLAFCDYFGPSAIGGSELVAAETYRRLVAWGAEVTVVTATPSALPPVESHAGCHVVSVPAYDMSARLGAQLAFAGRLPAAGLRRARCLRPRVLHAHSLHFESSVVAAMVRHRRRIPLVTTVHLAGTDHLPAPLRQVTNAYERSVGRFILSASSEVIAVSDAVAGHLQVRGVDAQRLHIIHNGVDHARFAPADVTEDRGANTGTEPDGPEILFVGRLITNKGPETFLEALSSLNVRGVSFRATLCGDGPQRAEIERRIHEGRLEERVRCVGAVHDVPDRLRRAAILVRPSLSEGLSLALLEAMAARVCVIASDVPGNAELVDHEVNGLLIPPQSGFALANALERVLKDPAARHRLASAGYRTSLAYSWDACAAHTGRVLVDAARATPGVR